MQLTQQPAQNGEQLTAFWTLLDMPLQPRAPARGKLSVEVIRHPAWRPPMIAAETHAMEELAHQCCDPVKARRGSYTGRPSKGRVKQILCVAELLPASDLLRRAAPETRRASDSPDGTKTRCRI